MPIKYSWILTLLLVGCKSTGPAISQISGGFSGNLITYDSANFQKTSVSALIPGTQGKAKVIDVKDSSGNNLLSLRFTDLNDSGLTITSSKGLSGSQHLQFDVVTGCYFNSGIGLCASSPEITFNLSDEKGNAVLSLVLYANAEPSPSETPQIFTLSQAITRAQNMSFQSKIEFEHVIQARAMATAAYLHLFPQLTLPTVINNVEPGISSLLGAIADVAPFLLPSRWFQAKEAEKQSQAEQDSERLMRLDMAAQIEGLFYTYDRDQKSQAIYKSFESRVTSILDQVARAESLGQLVEGSTDTVQAAFNDLTHNDGVYDQVLTEDRSALSQALGYFSPLTVQDAVIDGEITPVESAVDLKYLDVLAPALARSVEVDQFNDLVAQAEFSKKEEYFDWLDPVSNPQLGLGLALPSQLTVAQSQVRELEEVIDQTRAEISQEAFNSVTDYNQAIDNFQDAQSDILLHEKRLNIALQQLNSGANVDVFDLCSVIADDLGANLAVEQARAVFRVARAEIDRLLLQNFYRNF